MKLIFFNFYYFLNNFVIYTVFEFKLKKEMAKKSTKVLEYYKYINQRNLCLLI